MISALFYGGSFLFALCAAVLLPKVNKKINFIIDILFSYVTIMNVAALAIFVCNIVKVPVSQISMGCIFILLGTIATVGAIIQKKVQKHSISKWDLLAVGALIFVVLGIMLYVFTPYLHFNYYNNVDPSNHFLYAVSIVRSKRLTGMFYNSLYNGMFMQLFTWLVPQSWAYKAFILSDIYHLTLELLFFYAAMLVFMTGRDKATRKAFFLSLGYWLTYILFSFIWGFIYWSMAAMLVQYILVLIYCQSKELLSGKKSWIYIGIGFFSATMCYIQFAPIIVGIILSVVVYRLWSIGKLRINRKQIGVLVGVLIFLMILALFGYKLVFADNGVQLIKALMMGQQQNIGLEIVLLIPVTVCVLISSFKEDGKYTDMQIAYMATLSMQVLLTILTICHLLSTYYLQKSYIIITFLAVVVVLEGWEMVESVNRKRLQVFYLAALAWLAVSYAGDESQTISLQQSVLVQNAKIFTSYDFSDGALSENSKIYLMQYVAEEYAKEHGATPLISSGGIGRGIGLWYDATYDNVTFIGVEDATCTVEEMQARLEQCNAKSFFVFYDDLLYIFDLHDYLDSFERVYQNEAGFVARIK